MNRLQVGDECYVRDCTDGKIYKCAYSGQIDFAHFFDNDAWEHSASPVNKHRDAIRFAIGKGSLNRLVYPFPCIKELAK